jgi:hypothetical protein
MRPTANSVGFIFNHPARRVTQGVGRLRGFFIRLV